MNSLHVQCSWGDLNRVRELIAQGADVNEFIGAEPLCFASSRGHLEIVKLLIQHGAEINSTHPKAIDTALDATCWEGQYHVAEYLLGIGAKGFRSVYTCCLRGHLDLLKLLFRHGANVYGDPGDKYLPFYRACTSRQWNVAKYLRRIYRFASLYTLFGPDIARDFIIRYLR